MEPLEFNLDNFEGPMELLLFLLEKDEISVVDLSIDTLTEQYLAWLHKAQEMDMDVASEFLLMAAELIRIKLKKLLPKKQVEEKDSEQNLLDQLALYRFHRDQRIFFEQQYDVNSVFLSRNINFDALKKIYQPKVALQPLPVTLLYAAYDDLAGSVEERLDVYEVKRSKYNLTKLLTEILHMLDEEQLSLKEILKKSPTRDFVLDIFLVLLEGVRRGQVEVYQQELFAPIVIKKRDG